jgi:transcriptional regulator with XRE-family HTH domain
MDEEAKPLESRALILMRSACDWKKYRLAKALGLQPATFYDYEAGRVTPSRAFLERAAAALGFGPAFVDRTFSYLRQADADRLRGSGPGDAASDREIDRIASALSQEVDGFVRQSLQRLGQRTRAFEERQAARVLWARLAPHTAKERQAIVR